LELMGGPDSGSSPEAALEFLSQYATFAVVTLGERGCIAKKQGEAAVAQPAVSGEYQGKKFPLWVGCLAAPLHLGPALHAVLALADAITGMRILCMAAK
jgi:hypothetical protein